MKAKKRILHWTPRVVCILAILFISMFALDAFQPSLTVWQQIRAFLMHLTPSFILLILLLVSWRWELIGGSLFVLIGVALTPIIFKHNYAMNNSVGTSIAIISTITVPFIIVGVLFILNHYHRKKG